MKDTLNKLRDESHNYAKSKGFYDNEPRNFGELIALIHSEVSEALEADRRGDINMVGEEFADILIRVFDAAGYYNIDLDYHVKRKMDINKNRPYKHGKKY